jgi:hypothetical protein
MAPNSAPNPPLLKADTATLTFSASKDGKNCVTYAGWEDTKTVLEGQLMRRHSNGVIHR